MKHGLSKLIHQLLLHIVKNRDLPTIVNVNEPPEVEGGAIYVTNHQCIHDIPVATISVSKHVFLLMGKQRLKVQDRLFFILNGSIWVDRKSKKSRFMAKAKMKKLLTNGESVLLFPEGTWNYHPHNLLLPLNWGCVEIAQVCNAPIIPFVMDYRDDICRVKWGEIIEMPNHMDKKEGIAMVEESMATLLWELCEDTPMMHRKDVPDDWWDKEWRRRVQAYPKLDEEYERSVARKNN